MALINCPECSQGVSDSAPACPNCGFAIREWQGQTSVESNRGTQAKPEKKMGCLGKVVLLCFVLGGLPCFISEVISVPNPTPSSPQPASAEDFDSRAATARARLEVGDPEAAFAIVEKLRAPASREAEMQKLEEEVKRAVVPHVLQKAESALQDARKSVEAGEKASAFRNLELARKALSHRALDDGDRAGMIAEGTLIKNQLDSLADDPKSEFEILEDESSTLKRSVDVRLPERVSEDELERIAKAIKGSGPAAKRTFIVYYLPGMTPGAGGWATTHFTPELSTTIMGETLESARQTEDAAKDSQLDEYRDPRPYGPKRVWIEKSGDHYVVVQVLFDESEGRFPVTKVTRGGIDYYHPLEESSTGDHWRKPTEGPLEVWDSSGLIARYEPIN